MLVSISFGSLAAGTFSLRTLEGWYLTCPCEFQIIDLFMLVPQNHHSNSERVRKDGCLGFRSPLFLLRFLILQVWLRK